MSLRGTASIFSVLLAALAIPASAEAQVSIGELAPIAEPYCGGGPFENVPGPGTSLGTYTVPVSGVITSWSTKATVGAGQTLTFKAYRRVDATHYVPVGHDGPRELTASAVNTFKTAIPVQAGDVIGNNDLAHVEEVHNACEFQTGTATDIILCSELQDDFPDGMTFEIFPNCEEGVRPNVSAILLPPPTVTSISPASGSFKGGSKVVVAGTNFAELKGVSFGSIPASGFTVDSEGQITATAPASATLTKIGINVTTIAGTATSATRFSYKGCKVPKLLGKKLKASKKRTRKAGCKIGKVKKTGDTTGKNGKVVKQNPKPGKLLPSGAKIRVTLG